MRVLEDPAAVPEASEKRGLPPSASGGGDPLIAGNRPRAVGELVGPQELAAQRPGEKIAGGRRRPGEESREAADQR